MRHGYAPKEPDIISLPEIINDSEKVLFIVPHQDFYDEEYFELKEALEEHNVETNVCSTLLSEAQGRFKAIVEPEFSRRRCGCDRLRYLYFCRRRRSQRVLSSRKPAKADQRCNYRAKTYNFDWLKRCFHYIMQASLTIEK